jgi:hypothetical protein
MVEDPHSGTEILGVVPRFAVDSYEEAVESTKLMEAMGTLAWVGEQSRRASLRPADGIPARKIFLSLLSEATSPSLRARGFSKKRQRFVRWVGDKCLVVDFQGYRYSTATQYKFRVNLGILSKVVQQRVGIRLSDAKFPRVSECNWRVCLGALIVAKPADWWWVLNTDGKPREVIEEMNSFLLRLGDPFLEWCVSVAGMRHLEKLTAGYRGGQWILFHGSPEMQAILPMCFPELGKLKPSHGIG